MFEYINCGQLTVDSWQLTVGSWQRENVRKRDLTENCFKLSAGAYFVTICTQNRRCVLSRIVGRGLAPAEASGMEYTSFGKIAEQQRLSLKDRYAYLSVEPYAIMPNHIRVVLIFGSEAAGASPRPTITDIVCTYKSLTRWHVDNERMVRKTDLTENCFKLHFMSL